MTLLLTGATGKTGRCIVQSLAARGLRARVLLRNPLSRRSTGWPRTWAPRWRAWSKRCCLPLIPRGRW